ncbi:MULTISPECIES: DUF6755 family protein [Flavobacterium]|jgi:high-affinity Fe2+/Pb2+ permease|uniref:DUF6755 family protein n=1 Tax=Flavobacterium TaxID=237 RepID=UPI00047A5736|nr:MULTISPECIES: DUF6755 family protein [Flavobacterium]
MSNFRTNQNNANTNKLNVILSTVIVILVMNVGLQIWLLYTALNYTLDNDQNVATIAFYASVVIFLICLGLLYYIPMGKKTKTAKRSAIR